MAKAIAAAADDNSRNPALTGVKAQIERVTSFLHDVRSEMKKVVTPTREDTQNSTIVVLVTVFLFAAFFWVVDTIFGQGVAALLHKLTQH
jgi:preprotein translocase subunit SecE